MSRAAVRDCVHNRSAALHLQVDMSSKAVIVTALVTAAVTAAADEFEIGWAVWSADAAMGYRRASGWNTSLVDESDATLLEALGLQPA